MNYAESIPKMMRAVRLDEVGPPDNLHVVERPVPAVGPHDVLIRTALAGMIYADAEARKGTYFNATSLPWFPGREVAGTVVASGEAVDGYAPGDRVMALVLAGGCYADYVLASPREHVSDNGVRAPGADIVKLPDNVAFEQGLVYLVNFRLAHLVVHALAKVPRGARIAIHGAAGGMGTMVTQIAVVHGCEVVALCRGAQEVAFCLANGAASAIDTVDCDYVEAVRELTGGEGVDFSFNGVGGATINRDPLIVKAFGEVILYGYVAGKTPLEPFDIDKTWALKLFSATDYLSTPHFAAATAAMLDWLATRPLLALGEVFPLSRVADAHRALEAGKLLCKLGLRPDAP
ncbi:PKS_ER domain-containing protein [Paraburkholderia unamae]|uniref:quinone oxidoreductase family protein n=1 Tax=Paraburkholderia unamae TaxID=219649 RepID=UPI001CB2A9C0|nr:zinc-binding dehydrogenase [Paraburkholderia unamae]CAG9243208.1 PKS_ER domain-containing protein [Paraburkholderia unamae]